MKQGAVGADNVTQNSHITNRNTGIFPSYLCRFSVQVLIVVTLAFTFYGNTFRNEYALDDALVIIQNDYVGEGLHGVWDILSKDSYDSYYGHLRTSDQVPGGRYRPLSIITFALEQQFMGPVSDSKGAGGSGDEAKQQQIKLIYDMHVRHVFNVAWYALSLITLLWFLRYVVFRGNPAMALIAGILFAVHPLHTEVVANVKSRDEIMSLLFISLTFVMAFKYLEQRKAGLLAASLLCYFLAFLSKEYAITLSVLLPLSFYLFRSMSIKKSLLAAVPYFIVVAIYIVIRLLVMPARMETPDNDIQTNPYAYASANEKTATIIATSLNYLKLLVFPHPLSSDYSYNQIPYKDFSYPIVWVSLFVHVALILMMFYFFLKRNVLCFALAFFVVHLVLVNNFIFNIGATMGERLIYHSSVGFAIAMAYLLYKGAERLQPASKGFAVMAVLIAGVVICSGFKVIERNKDWKNDQTLFFRDIQVSPNSFLVNVNVAAMLVNNADNESDRQKRSDDLHRGIVLLNKAISMQNNYVLGYMNRSVAWLKLGAADSVMESIEIVKQLYPIHPQLPDMYYYTGMTYMGQQQYRKATYAFQTTLQLNPAYTDAQIALRRLDSLGAIGR